MLAPVFFAALIGFVDICEMAWMQFGLEHAVQRAARCAALGANGPCPDAATTQSYAASQALALNLPASAFTSTATSNACTGQLVSANTNYYYFSNSFPGNYLTITARSCFPT